MKDNSFDFAIIPSEWFKDIEQLNSITYSLENLNFSINSLFDYNFEKYLKNNKIKAIPFALDPII
jgi:hypothetical protein